MTFQMTPSECNEQNSAVQRFLQQTLLLDFFNKYIARNKKEPSRTYRSGFLNPGTIDILDQIIICCRGFLCTVGCLEASLASTK